MLPQHPTNSAHLSVVLINTVCTDWLIAAGGDKQGSQNDVKVFLYWGHRSQYHLSGGNLSSPLNGCAEMLMLMLSAAPDSVWRMFVLFRSAQSVVLEDRSVSCGKACKVCFAA